MTRNSFFDLRLQKGFLPGVAGCLEHSALLLEALRDAGTHQRAICVSWLDLHNAFGSVRHSLIQFALRHHGLPPDFQRLVFDYYKRLFALVDVPGEFQEHQFSLKALVVRTAFLCTASLLLLLYCSFFHAMPRGRRSQPRWALVPTPHVDLNTLTVYKLHARCHDVGLPETGRKAALIARLSNANQPSRETVNQETPPAQHHGAESDSPLATDGALGRAIERILDRRLQAYGQTQTLNPLWRSSQDPSCQRSAQSETTPPQASTSSGIAPSSFTTPPSSTLPPGPNAWPPADTRRPAMITIPTASPVLSLPCLLAYEIASCEVSLLTSQNFCPRPCLTNTSSAPLHYPLLMGKVQTPSNLR